jgi:thiamine biosynthesis lipoprotein
MKKREIIIVVVILLICLFIISLRNLGDMTEKRILTVEVDNKIQYETVLSENIDKELKVNLKKGTAIVKIKNGRVRVLPLPKEICPTGRCWNTGWIENPGETIVCVPNKMVISIKEEKALYQENFLAMDTIFTITLTEENKGAVKDLKNIVEELDELFDVYNHESDIYNINANSGKYVSVKDNTYELLQRAYIIAEDTEGAFDPTIESLMKLWDIDKKRIPRNNEIESKLKLVNYKDIKFNKDTKSVMLESKEMQLNVGGIAKGFAVKKQIEVLKNAGITSTLISGGGNTYALGKKPDGSSWKIGIRDPRDKDNVIGYVELQNMAVDTSGDYERYFIKDGIRYHHIINSNTGHPARGLISVTVITKDPVEADALATALFVMGPQKAVNYVKKRDDIEVILVTQNMEVLVSKGADDIFVPNEGIVIKFF